MKKIPLFLLGFILIFSSCRKDEKQIIGTWSVEKVTIAGVDRTAEYKLNNYKETYADGGNYSFSGDPQNNSGSGKYTWEGKSIKRNGVSNQPSMDLSVQKVTKNEFEYKTSLNGEEAEFIFSQ